MSKSIPILVLDNTFTFGGAINSLYHLFRGLNKKRFAPILVTGQPLDFLEEHFTDCRYYHSLPRLPWIENHTYRQIAGLWVFRYRLLRKALNLSRFLYWIFFITLPEAYKYYRVGKKHQVALVHLNNILGSQLAGILAARFLRVPCVAHLQDFEEVHPVTRFYARLINHHVAISGAIKENLLQLGVHEEKITVVHHALDLDEFNSEVDCSHFYQEFGLDPDQPRFGIFGRVVEWKGIREFLFAARLVLGEHPAARAFVVGGPSDGDQGFFDGMKRLAAELGVEHKVFFTGYRKDVPALMKFMDVIVHASIRPEPFGMVVIEGMAMGKAVVATKAGGPLDIVSDGETGYLVDMGNSQSLGDAVSALLRDPTLRQAMGEEGRARVEKFFSSRRYADQMEAIYRRFADGGVRA